MISYIQTLYCTLKYQCIRTHVSNIFLGQRAREADRERVRQMRDQLRQHTAGEESGSQRGRGDPDFLPQV